jgi:hypothetical protein
MMLNIFSRGRKMLRKIDTIAMPFGYKARHVQYRPGWNMIAQPLQSFMITIVDIQCKTWKYPPSPLQFEISSPAVPSAAGGNALGRVCVACAIRVDEVTAEPSCHRTCLLRSEKKRQKGEGGLDIDGGGRERHDQQDQTLRPERRARIRNIIFFKKNKGRKRKTAR